MGSEFGLYPNGSGSFKQHSGLHKFPLERWVRLPREGMVGGQGKKKGRRWRAAFGAASKK